MATEAATAVLKYGFADLGFERVIAQVNSMNRASLRVCEKLRMKFDHSVERHERTVLVFAVSKAE